MQRVYRSHLRELLPRALREIRLQPRKLIPGRRPLPTFLIIGAQKSGTTSLYNFLIQHPRVQRSLAKEVHFFDNHYGRGTSWYRAHFASIRTGEGAHIGEATPYYLFHPHCPARVSAELPQVKLVVLLRNPIDRAYSHYHHAVRRYHEWLSFEEAIDREPERLARQRERMMADETFYSAAHQRHSYLARGRYFEQLQSWFRHFPRDRFFIRDAAVFRSDPKQVYAEVLEFLGLPQHRIERFPMHYSGRYSSMCSGTRQRLKDYFREPNTKLFDLLGSSYNWDC